MCIPLSCSKIESLHVYSFEFCDFRFGTLLLFWICGSCLRLRGLLFRIFFFTYLDFCVSFFFLQLFLFCFGLLVPICMPSHSATAVTLRPKLTDFRKTWYLHHSSAYPLPFCNLVTLYGDQY